MRYRNWILISSLLANLFFFTAAGSNLPEQNSIRIKFLNEFILPANTMFAGTTVGGLSSIDYHNGELYMVSDDNANAKDTISGPYRYYKAELKFGSNGIENINVTDVTEIKDQNGQSIIPETMDLESLRYMHFQDKLLIANEGQILKGINASIDILDVTGNQYETVTLPTAYQQNTEGTTGPYYNTAFESLSLSQEENTYWAAMEGPLKQDAPLATINLGAPVRIAKIDSLSMTFREEYIYPLDPVTHRADATENAFKVNGIVSILEYASKKMLVMERSFTSGLADGGNNVKIYDVDLSEATNIHSTISIKDKTYKVAKKKLVFDFESVRSSLTNQMVDNIEGMTFGPTLENGHKSLIVASDNNFNLFGTQLNQFIALELY